MARTKVSSGRAAAAAAEVVPDPHAVEAPPKEAPAADPWDADSEPVDVGQGDETAPPAASPPAAAPAASTTAWGAVIERVLTLDPAELYARLSGELTLGDGATEYGAVLAALDRAERNALDAVRLARFAKLEDERVAHVVNARLEVLRTAARDELDKEKAAGTRSKAPTIQDVEDRMVANWPDEMASLNRRKSEMHGTLRVMEGLETSWRSRCASLRAIMERVAPTRPR